MEKSTRTYENFNQSLLINNPVELCPFEIIAKTIFQLSFPAKKKTSEQKLSTINEIKIFFYEKREQRAHTWWKGEWSSFRPFFEKEN